LGPTLFPLELASNNGIDLGLRRITRGGEESRGFLLDLKKLDITLFFFGVNVGAIVFQLQSANIQQKIFKKGR
jgi:hypothetical protein